uniref:Uncharacterized protein n=1 Tax=Rhizophora mucronata TaxID=61149 RepID=A0A2P2M9K5_RHIMU
MLLIYETFNSCVICMEECCFSHFLNRCIVPYHCCIISSDLLQREFSCEH